MRKLATIRVINDIRPIPEADAIECAVVGGWTVVVKKGEYKAGDLAVYCEVDSFIPSTIAPFLTKPEHYPTVYEGVEGERLRTVRLRKQLSQGLLLPLSGFDAYFEGAGYTLFNEGDDVSSFLGIVKYEAPISAQLAGQVKGAFPSVVPKTDEERIQNMTGEIPELLTLRWELSEKMEGSSMTVARLDAELYVCSRNLSLRETEENSMWKLTRKYDIEAKMIAEGLDDFVIQGEIIGEGIQGNHYGIKGQDFYVFRMYNVKKGAFVEPEERRALCSKLGLKHVPVIAYNVDLVDTLGISTAEQILAFADGKSLVNPAKLREGVVYKEVGGQRHWKAVSNQYLLKTGG